MKKKLLKTTSLFLASFMLSTQALFAASPAMEKVSVSDMELNEREFLAEFAALDELEHFVNENGITDVASIEDDELASMDLEGFVLDNSITRTQGFEFSNFDWPSGLWGFLCCPIGFFVVITNKDKSKDQKISFWIGVAASTVISAITTPLYTSGL